MKFKIDKASDYNSRKSPCEGATEQRHYCSHSENYWSEWFIEINTLEDKEIIIYDDYLE